MAARVADRVDVVADAHDGDGHAVDLEPRGRCRSPRSSSAQTTRSCRRSDRRRRQRRSEVELGRRRGGADRRRASPTGSCSSTSSKKPSTTSRSATSGRHAAALEVEALLLVDRPDRRRVAALHVVGLDLEVGHALGPGALGQREVAVGLEGVGALGVLADPDQAGVHARRMVLHRALEQQVARWCAGRRGPGSCGSRASGCRRRSTAPPGVVEPPCRRAARRCGPGRSRRRARPWRAASYESRSPTACWLPICHVAVPSSLIAEVLHAGRLTGAHLRAPARRAHGRPRASAATNRSTTVTSLSAPASIDEPREHGDALEPATCG